jgi:cobalamin biosynthesis protein CobD/CbiB
MNMTALQKTLHECGRLRMVEDVQEATNNEKVDKATGCAKYIAGFIALVLGALLLWFLWFVLKYVWYLLRSLVGLIVGSSSMKSTIDPQSLQANSPIEKDSLGAQIPNKVDNEFDF